MNEFLKISEPKAVEYPHNSGIFTCYISSNILLDNLKLPDIGLSIWTKPSLNDLFKKPFLSA